MIRADPRARRKAVFLIIVGTLIGAVLIVSFERYRGELHEWLLADPSGHRIQLLLYSLAVLGAVPLIAFALYLWVLGVRVVQAQQFPPPGQRVVRDTAVVTGEAARSRGRVLQGLAIAFVTVAGLLCFLLWRVASVIVEQAV